MNARAIHLVEWVWWENDIYLLSFLNPIKIIVWKINARKQTDDQTLLIHVPYNIEIIGTENCFIQTIQK